MGDAIVSQLRTGDAIVPLCRCFATEYKRTMASALLNDSYEYAYDPTPNTPPPMTQDR